MNPTLGGDAFRRRRAAAIDSVQKRLFDGSLRLVDSTGAFVSAMTDLATIAGHLDALLGTATIPDYPGALNGVQLANRGPITQVAASVDISRRVVERRRTRAGEPADRAPRHVLGWRAPDYRSRVRTPATARSPTMWPCMRRTCRWMRIPR